MRHRRRRQDGPVIQDKVLASIVFVNASLAIAMVFYVLSQI